MQKKLRKISWCSLVVICILPLPVPGRAQPVGHPVASRSHNEITISFDAGIFKREIVGVENISRRWIFKAAYGFGGRLDLFGLFGIAKLRLLPSNSTAVFKDKYRPVFGGGFIWHFLNFVNNGVSIFIGAQLLKFKTNPAVQETVPVANSEVTKVTTLNYDWRDVNSNLGFNKKMARLNFYAGINTRLIYRRETRTVKLLLNSGGVSIDETKGKYRSGLLTSPFLGIELSFPARFKLNFEATATSRNSYSFYIGLSQTGIP